MCPPTVPSISVCFLKERQKMCFIYTSAMNGEALERPKMFGIPASGEKK
jgi:hypothetical protein